MGLIADLKKLIYEEEVKYRAAVSESTWYKIGGTLNFLLNKNHQEKSFYLNGAYSGWTTPRTFADGLSVFAYDAEIFAITMYNLNAGSSGTTEIDLKLKPQLSGAFTSIFTTTPKITYQAGQAWVSTGDTINYCTAPVLTSGASPLQVNKGDGICIDLISSQVGASNCGLIVHFRPR